MLLSPMRRTLTAAADRSTYLHTQVGLTAGPPGCTTDEESYGYFTRLSDKAS